MAFVKAEKRDYQPVFDVTIKGLPSDPVQFASDHSEIFVQIFQVKKR